MITLSKARTLRRIIKSLSVYLPDEAALESVELFPKWKVPAQYAVGDRIQYEGNLYKCIQSHTSQSDWTPADAVSLWAEVADPAIEWPEWKQPTGAHDAYMTGDKVTYEGRHYISSIDNNVYIPGIYGWDEV